MKHILLSSIVFITASAFAQDCSTEVLMKKPGTWKETSAVSQGLSATDIAREKKVIAAINTMIKSKYSPTAVNAKVNGGFSSPRSEMPVNDYAYSIIPLEYYCDGSTTKIAGETATYFHIGINYFTSEVYDTAQGDRALMEGFNVLTQMPRSKDGYYYFEEMDVPLGMSLTGKSRMWLITYDGKIPWSYVTKKEFLEKRKRNLFTQMASDASGIKDVLNNLEIEKGFKEKEYKNDAEKMQKYMKMDYLPGKERYTKFLAELENKYKPAFKKIDDQLKMSAAELNETAMVKMDPHDELSYLFTTESDPFAKILIKPNPSYFNKKLPRSVPQFISVYIRGNPKDPVVAKTMTDLVKAIDFTTLKGMIGK